MGGRIAGGQGPTIALRPAIEARAKRTTIEPRDLPGGWLTDRFWKRALVAQQGPVWSCNGHTADLSGLVVRGAWSSENDFVDPSGLWQVTSMVAFLGTRRQAQVLFQVGASYFPHYCSIVGEKVAPDTVLRSIRSLGVPRVADQEVAFRSLLRKSTGHFRATWADLVLLRRESVYEQLVLSRNTNPFPASLEDVLIRKFAGRAG